jgi:hypothetical protein
MQENQLYPTDPTDRQWDYIKDLIPLQSQEADIPGSSIELIRYEQEIQDPLILQMGLALQERPLL